MTAPTLVELRTRVRERGHFSANDPMFSDSVVNRRINIAYGDVLSGTQPNGWWWQHAEVTLQNTSGGDLALMPVVLPTPDNARTIRKVHAVFCGTDNDYWTPVPQRERSDQIRLAGGRRTGDGIPLAWSVVPSPTTVGGVRRQIVLAFDTPLPNLMYVRFQCVVDAADFTSDASVAVGIPPVLAELIVESVVVALIRQKRNVGVITSRRRFATELSIAGQALDGWMKDARRYFSSAAAGAGSGELHERGFA